MNHFLSKFLYYAVIKPLSMLPMAVLFGFSNFTYLLVYHVFSYRKKVVISNIALCFPEYSSTEINTISKKFYKHFVDLIFESIKVLSMNQTQLHKYVHIENSELVQTFINNKQSVILCCGHYASWEYAALGFGTKLNSNCMGIYKPLSNKYFDTVIKNSRGKFGLNLVSVSDVKAYFAAHWQVPTAYGFIADQNPSNPTKANWIRFFNQKIPVSGGIELYAKMYNMPVVYASISKIARGKYSIQYQLLTQEPTTKKEGEINLLFYEKLKNQIQQNPEYWLWTHKRFKHSNNPKFAENVILGEV
jgi:Kdo2-lipid IVA lauroyltransferase/acyltransferase